LAVELAKLFSYLSWLRACHRRQWHKLRRRTDALRFYHGKPSHDRKRFAFMTTVLKHVHALRLEPFGSFAG
jgi:hypothetical protein